MIYNPSKLMNNCGFCSISRGLHRRNVIVDADQLYLGMLKKLQIPHDGIRDPVPRTLFFPKRMSDNIPIPTTHQILADMNIPGAHYSIVSAAEYSGLPLSSGNLNLLQEFLKARAEGANWDDLTERRADALAEDAERRRRAIKIPEHSVLKKAILRELVGDSIIGSKTAQHFVNLNIDGNGRVEAYDAQIDHTIRSIPQRLGTVDLYWKPA